MTGNHTNKFIKNYSEEKFFIILEGDISLMKSSIGKLMTINHYNTLGEEIIIDRMSGLDARKETAFVESNQAVLLEIGSEQYLKIKELLYEAGLKKDYLMIESILRRNYINKKNHRS